MSNALGTHIILDLYGCNPEVMLHVPSVQSIMRRAAEEAQFTVVTDEYHQFEPHGVSGATIIQESHLCLHSWPEYKFASIDIYYCGENDNVEKAITFLIQTFNPTHIERKDSPRGIPEIYNRY